MDILSCYEAKHIQWLQGFQFPLAPLLVANLFCAPYTVTVSAFPLAFLLHPVLGVSTLLSFAFAEGLNGLLKWILFGDRPFWWVLEYHMERINLTQFSGTCETGPGGLSDHCIVSVAGWLPLTLYLRQRYPRGRIVFSFLFVAFVSVVGISRLYIAADFPHQVFSGIASGALIGVVFYRWTAIYLSDEYALGTRTSAEKLLPIFLNPLWLGLLSFCLLAIAYVFENVLETMNVDVNWSLTLAKKACARPEWIYPSMSLIANYARIAGLILGLAVSFAFRPAMSYCREHVYPTFKRTFIVSILGVICVSSVYSLRTFVLDALELPIPTWLHLLDSLQTANSIFSGSSFVLIVVKSALCPIFFCLILPLFASSSFFRYTEAESVSNTAASVVSCPPAAFVSSEGETSIEARKSKPKNKLRKRVLLRPRENRTPRY